MRTPVCVLNDIGRDDWGGIGSARCNILYQTIVMLNQQMSQKLKRRRVNSKRRDTLLGKQILPITIIVFAEEENGIKNVAS